ncbi:DUF4105 domain-containing protein [Terrihabitans soli]|uniref:Lnb N-terminal periplasmic domain-containing protein n=1 Tax=Terrihabitans soli TaxID=708113 RepID=UPI001CED418A|nr:DUF4105 domain-containing protein [Terrihabitans soli]
MLGKTTRVIRSALLYLCLVLASAWGVLALYFSNLPSPALRLCLAIGFLVFAVAVWIKRRTPLMSVPFWAVFAAAVVWWVLIPPSHDRVWRPDHAVLPRAAVSGDVVKISGVRNFDYRSRSDFTPHYEERTFDLSHLTGIDFYISYWRPGAVAHTFLSFTFDNAPPLSISIEARREIHEGFDPLGSLFKQFELIYVVGDERDLVGSRANHRNETVYLYRLNTRPEDARRLLLIYLERINEIYDRPEFYHLLSNSCTINIIRYANAIGRTGGFDIRHFLNGWIDGYLYYSGRLNTSRPLDELRAQSQINDAARAAETAADFSAEIRKGVPPSIGNW